MKKTLLILATGLLPFTNAFGQNWSVQIDDIVTFSSPRPADLNGDGVNDIVIGGGVEGEARSNAIIATDGATGDIFWTVPADDEIFGSAVFQDITGDDVPDIFIGGRNAHFLAINGSNGEVLWDYINTHGNPVPEYEKILNFYTAQLLPDQDNDGHLDLLVAYGGDHAAPLWETNRPEGRLMILSSATGSKIAEAAVPDGKETYMSPLLLDYNKDGNYEIIFGTGGETIGGNLYITSLESLINNDLSSAILLAEGSEKGFISPPSLVDLTGDGNIEIIAQGYDGTVKAVYAENGEALWSFQIPGTESMASPIVGNFTGDITPDVFAVIAKGVAPSFTDYYQVLLDGSTGKVVWKDSLADMVFPSPVAFDYNGNGRDEVILSGNFRSEGSFKHALFLLDFQNDVIDTLFAPEAGINLISTPLLSDLDSDGNVDLVYSYRKNDQNPSAPDGIYVKRIELDKAVPPVGIAYGAYMGNEFNGMYNYKGVLCADGGPAVSAAITKPCNTLNDGRITLNISGGSEPFTYVWSNGSIVKDLNNIGVGEYKVRITDSNGCYTDLTRSVAPKYTISQNISTHNTCPDEENGRASVSSSGCGCSTSNCTYAWSNGEITHTATNLPSGKHEVIITHTDGCKALETIIIKPEPFEVTTHSGTDEDGTGIGEVSVSGGTPPYTIVWDDEAQQTGETAYGLSSGNYHVQITDDKGCTSSANVIIELPVLPTKQSLEAFIKVYPNPSQGIFNISGENLQKTEISVSDMQGRLVKKVRFSGHTYTLNCTGLPAGIYSLHIRSGKKSEVVKVVVNQ